MSFRSLLLRHGYAFLFCYVFAVQVGMPIPADPLLLIMGALVGDGRYSLLLSIGGATLSALAGDYIWFELGRRKGSAILTLLCKLSLEPDTCVRKTQTGLSRHGAWTLVFAKFVPGMSLVSTPLAGAVKMNRAKFLLADGVGSFLWTAGYVLVGRIFHHQVDAIVGMLGLFGRRAGATAIALIAAYVAFRYFQRWRFLRQLRVNRITPEEAFALMNGAEPVVIVDLRNAKEIAESGFKVAGALVLSGEDLRSRSHGLNKEQKIILYCSCPNENTSGRVALQLKKAGLARVHPLTGGLEAWMAAKLPVEPAGEQAISQPVLI